MQYPMTLEVKVAHDGLEILRLFDEVAHFGPLTFNNPEAVGFDTKENDDPRKMNGDSMVQMLGQLSNAAVVENNEKLLTFAANCDDIEVMKTLLRDYRIQPGANYNHTFRSACLANKVHLVCLLLKDDRVNPADYCNEALRFASRDGFSEICEMLLGDSRVNPCGTSLMDNSPVRFAILSGAAEIISLFSMRRQVQMHSSNLAAYQRQKLRSMFEQNLARSLEVSKLATGILRSMPFSRLYGRLPSDILHYILALAFAKDLIISYWYREEIMDRSQQLLRQLDEI